MNTDVTKEDIDFSLTEYKKQGIGGAFIHPRTGLQTEYLSDEWFELVDYAVDKGKELKLNIWIYDEYVCPSGFAGGKFSTECPDLRMQSLDIAERIAVAPGETLSRRLSQEVVGAIAINQVAGTGQALDVRSGDLHWTAPDGVDMPA